MKKAVKAREGDKNIKSTSEEFCIQFPLIRTKYRAGNSIANGRKHNKGEE
jgi:hypothetical protein